MEFQRVRDRSGRPERLGNPLSFGPGVPVSGWQLAAPGALHYNQNDFDVILSPSLYL